MRTIRFWTGEDLLQVTDTTASNHALYDPDPNKQRTASPPSVPPNASCA